jgi:hypothetical protein
MRSAVGFFLCLSLCTFAFAAMQPMGDVRDARLRHARREIADTLKPSVVAVGQPAVESARAGAGTGGASRDPPPGADDSFFAQELSDNDESNDFIAADIGKESATPHDDDTGFWKTIEVEAGTTPPETTATA